MSTDSSGIKGEVVVELRDAAGQLKSREVIHNLITDTGDQVYGARASGAATPPAAPIGMKLGTQAGPAAASKNGTGAALQTYLTGSNLAFDTTPTAVNTPGAGTVVTYKCTYGAGVANSLSAAITEAVIFNDSNTNVTSNAAGTVSRVLLTGIASKQATDTLTITWTHTLLGA